MFSIALNNRIKFQCYVTHIEILRGQGQTLFGLDQGHFGIISHCLDLDLNGLLTRRNF